jgi:hypothetical protein
MSKGAAVEIFSFPFFYFVCVDEKRPAFCFFFYLHVQPLGQQSAALPPPIEPIFMGLFLNRKRAIITGRREYLLLSRMYGPGCRRPILYTALMTWKPASCTYIGWEEKQIKK